MSRRVVAMMALTLQKRKHHQFTMRDDIAFFISSLSFDETMEKVSLDVHGMKDPVKGTWKVLVSEQKWYIGLTSCANGWVSQVVRPVIPLVTSTASVLHQGLWGHPAVADFARVESRMQDRASLAAILHTDRDGAASNDLAIAWRQKSLPEHTSTGGPVLASDMTCGNHRNQLCEVAVANLLGIDMIGSVYRFCLLVRMGCIWMRCVLSVPAAVQELMQVCDAAEPMPPISTYNAEWVDYLASNFKMVHRAAGQVSEKSLAGDDSEAIPTTMLCMSGSAQMAGENGALQWTSS